MMQVAGLTRSQVYESLGICFLVGGPRGMETIALAVRDYEWIEPSRPATFPDGWAHRPEFLSSGLDFSTREASAGDVEKMRDWYLRTLGEVPPYVELLLDLRPSLLKAYRDRYENLLRALGVSRQQVVNIAGSASLNGGMAGFSLMARAAGDVLRNWNGND
jgi:hypothetical protein